MSKVPIVKNFTMGDCMAAQRRCENSSFEHAHYGALRCVTGPYRPVKGVALGSLDNTIPFRDEKLLADAKSVGQKQLT
jgi:hypothetical protein